MKRSRGVKKCLEPEACHDSQTLPGVSAGWLAPGPPFPENDGPFVSSVPSFVRSTEKIKAHPTGKSKNPRKERTGRYSLRRSRQGETTQAIHLDRLPRPSPTGRLVRFRKSGNARPTRPPAFPWNSPQLISQHPGCITAPFPEWLTRTWANDSIMNALMKPFLFPCVCSTSRYTVRRSRKAPVRSWVPRSSRDSRSRKPGPSRWLFVFAWRLSLAALVAPAELRPPD